MAGIIFKRSERVFSVNWVREKSISHRSWPSSRNSAMTAGAWWNKMFFLAWANQRNQPNATGNIFARLDIDSNLGVWFKESRLILQKRSQLSQFSSNRIG